MTTGASVRLKCSNVASPDFSPEIWRNLYFFRRSLAATVLPGRPTAPLELLGLPELLNAPLAGGRALLFQYGQYLRWQLFDIRRFRTRSLRGVVHNLIALLIIASEARFNFSWRPVRLGFALRRIGAA
jgi:membrane-bound metal-dependent hydrolase YbcI (DUF457 family)